MNAPTDQDQEAAAKHCEHYYSDLGTWVRKLAMREFLAGAAHGRKAERARCAEIADKIGERKINALKRAELDGRLGVASHRMSDHETCCEIASAIREGEKES